MTDMQIVYLVVTILALLLISGAAYLLGIKRGLTPMGARKRTGKILARIASRQGFKLYNDVAIKDDSTNIFTADHVLMGDFGILLVKDVNVGQIVYGEPKAQSWKINDGKEDYLLPNPLAELEQFIPVLRSSLSKQGVYNVPITPLVVFSQRFTTPDLFVGGVPHTISNKLTRYISQNKITDKMLSLDITKMSQALDAVRADGQ